MNVLMPSILGVIIVNDLTLRGRKPFSNWEHIMLDKVRKKEIRNFSLKE